jgi:hypothetical protein
MSIASDLQNSRRSDDRPVARPDLRTTTSGFFGSPTGRRFLEELAYYRADEPYLPIEKRAERCAALSVLLTAAIRAGGQRSLDFAPRSTGRTTLPNVLQVRHSVHPLRG